MAQGAGLAVRRQAGGVIRRCLKRLELESSNFLIVVARALHDSRVGRFGAGTCTHTQRHGFPLLLL